MRGSEETGGAGATDWLVPGNGKGLQASARLMKPQNTLNTQMGVCEDSVGILSTTPGHGCPILPSCAMGAAASEVRYPAVSYVVSLTARNGGFGLRKRP